MPAFTVLLASTLALALQIAPPSKIPDAPQSLQPRNGETLLLHLLGKGSQIYICQNTAGTYAWKFKAPDAQLFAPNGDLIGHHFAGPTWEATDGSRVIGKVIATFPSPDPQSVPWLLLTAASHEGSGLMTKVVTIQRLTTKGGVPPSSTCSATNEGKELPVPYQADYYFYGAP